MTDFLRATSARSSSVFMFKCAFFLFLLLLSWGSWAQTDLTMNGVTANWNTTANWTSSNFPDNINENAILAQNARPTVTASVSIGSLTGNGDNTITINSGVTLTIGANGNAKNLLMNGNNPSIVVYGTLVIWGNATFVNKVSWTIAAGASVIIKGNLDMQQGTSMNVDGSLRVEGNLTSGNNSDMQVNGTGSVLISNNVTVGSGNLNGSGVFQFGGTCSGPTTSYCKSSNHNATLPVDLLYFRAIPILGKEVKLEWATSSELNFDYFDLKRSADGKKFESIGKVLGHGTTREHHDYSLVDEFPLMGTSYYRLESVDFDGYTETFNVVSASLDGEKDATLYPVPVTDAKLSFRLNFLPKTEIAVSVASMMGVERARGIISSNETDVKMDLDLEPGVYIVRMNSINFNKVSRIVVK